MMCNMIGRMVIFGCPFFFLLGPLVINSAIQFCIFLAVWIRPTLLVGPQLADQEMRTCQHPHPDPDLVHLGLKAPLSFVLQFLTALSA